MWPISIRLANYKCELLYLKSVAPLFRAEVDIMRKRKCSGCDHTNHGINFQPNQLAHECLEDYDPFSFSTFIDGQEALSEVYKKPENIAKCLWRLVEQPDKESLDLFEGVSIRQLSNYFQTNPPISMTHFAKEPLFYSSILQMAYNLQPRWGNPVEIGEYTLFWWWPSVKEQEEERDADKECENGVEEGEIAAEEPSSSSSSATDIPPDLVTLKW